MESKSQQKRTQVLYQVFERMDLFFKRFCFRNLKLMKRKENQGEILFKYVGKQSQKELRWLFSLDKIEHSEKAAKISQDVQAKIHQTKISYSHHQHQSLTSKTRATLKRIPISEHRKMDQEQKLLKNIQLNQNSSKDAIPLSLEESSKIFEQFEESNDDEDYINRIRQRKYKRQQFKSRLAQEQHSKNDIALKKKEIKEPQIMNKKQKCNLCQHFIEVDGGLRQSEKQVFSKKISRGFHKKYKTSNKSLTNSPQKQVIKKNSLIYTTREWQPLKTQDRQLVLKPINQLKLAVGVTTRQHSNKSISFEPNINPISSQRKKLLLFKNNDKHPAKIRLNELLSLKKLGTMTHLAYCTSMKTMKDIKDTKQNIESNVSIDSKQFPSEISGNQKRLIKIANRRVFQQLMNQQCDSGAQDLSNYRSKMKMKKQGKVRFDNII